MAATPAAGARLSDPPVSDGVDPWRRDAALLGQVYWTLQAITKRSTLDALQVPPNLSVNQRPVWQLKKAIASALGQGHEDAYVRAYHDSVERVHRVALDLAAVALERQIRDLTAFDRRLDQPGTASFLNTLAERVRRQVTVFAASGKDYDSARKELKREPRNPGLDLDFAQAQDEALRLRVLSAVSAELAELGQATEATAVCLVLAAHPDFVEILSRYEQSAQHGTRYAHRLVTEAFVATGDFMTRLRDKPKHLWRYQILVDRAVRHLGLHDVLGFPEYLAEVARILAQDPLEHALFVAGLVLLVAGLAFSGPAGAAGAGPLTALAAAEFAVNGANAYLTFRHEQEQNLAALSTGFSPPERFARRAGWGRTALAAAGAVVATINLVKAGVGLARGPQTARPVAEVEPVSTGRRSGGPADVVSPRGTENRGTEPSGLREPDSTKARGLDRVRLRDDNRGLSSPRRDRGPGPDTPPAARAQAAGAEHEPPPDAVSRPRSPEPARGGSGPDRATPVAGPPPKSPGASPPASSRPLATTPGSPAAGSNAGGGGTLPAKDAKNKSPQTKAAKSQGTKAAGGKTAPATATAQPEVASAAHGDSPPASSAVGGKGVAARAAEHPAVENPGASDQAAGKASPGTAGRATDSPGTGAVPAAERIAQLKLAARSTEFAAEADLNLPKASAWPRRDRSPFSQNRRLEYTRADLDPELLIRARRVRATEAGVGYRDFIDRNVAVARVVIRKNQVVYLEEVNVPGRVLGGGSGIDSEQLILGRIIELKRTMGLKDTEIVLEQLYTERVPCDACGASLNRPGYTETAVFFTVPDATDVSRAVALMRAYGLHP